MQTHPPVLQQIREKLSRYEKDPYAKDSLEVLEDALLMLEILIDETDDPTESMTANNLVARYARLVVDQSELLLASQHQDSEERLIRMLEAIKEFESANLPIEIDLRVIRNRIRKHLFAVTLRGYLRAEVKKMFATELSGREKSGEKQK